MFNSESKLRIDRVVQTIFLLIGILCASVIVFIVVFILAKGIRPFVSTYANGEKASFIKFISSTSWSTETFGVLGMAINTLYLTILSIVIASPISIFTALFIVRIAPKKLGASMQMVVELLASIPSIVFGLFGMGVINPLSKSIAQLFNVQTAGGMSGLSTVIVLIMMMLPTITMLSITSMKAVKPDQIQASLALGATKAQTDFKIVIGGAKSGIFAAIILGVGRALGEATAVSMVCGNASEGPNFNLFSTTRTLTSTMMMGFHEASGLEYDIKFSIGIVLIIIILITNVTLNYIKRRMERI